MRAARAMLALEDGTVFEGRAFGRRGEAAGEVVFNTALTGYQEVLTDPSYSSQIVTMTYPHIGNTGVNAEDVESARPQVAAFIVREISATVSSWRATGALDAWLDEHGVVGLAEIDTRALTRRLRTHGAQRGVVSSVELDPATLVARARASRSMAGLDLAREVTCRAAYAFDEPAGGFGVGRVRDGARIPDAPGAPAWRVVAYDFGIKRNILRLLRASGCAVTVVPAQTTAAEVLGLQPDGVFLSNGPGDPEPVSYAIEAVRRLMDARLPILGICLGHQILGLACGGRTYKLKFGHRGANQPVKDLRSGRVEITSQNHGFAVERGLFERPELELTHVNLNDDTVEGFRHRELPLLSVQYHPEASPGPHDSHPLFDEFVALMSNSRERW